MACLKKYPNGKKVCRHCGDEKLLCEFSKGYKGQPASYCKLCSIFLATLYMMRKKTNEQLAKTIKEAEARLAVARQVKEERGMF